MIFPSPIAQINHFHIETDLISEGIETSLTLSFSSRGKHTVIELSRESKELTVRYNVR